MRSRLARWFFGSVAAGLTLFGLIGVVLTLYSHLHNEQGAASWVNVYGQTETWAGVAGRLAGGLLLLLAGIALGAWQFWRRSREEGVSMKQIRDELMRGP